MSEGEIGAWRWLKPFLEARGLRAPDGRDLYKYRLSATELESLKSVLRETFRDKVASESRSVGALFCLWTAHWFQKTFQGGYYNWNGPSEAIGAALDQSTRSRLVEEGLSYLGRSIRILNGTREFLVTLILEGGFPSKMVVKEGRWLVRYIEAVTLATGQGQCTIESALDHALFYESIVPPSFQAVSLLYLVAELAHSVAELRKRLVDAGITAGAIEWLDRATPRWRDELPIPTGDAAARRLVERLVRVNPRAAVMPVECRRLLCRDGPGIWSFGVRLQIEGQIDNDDLPPDVGVALDTFSRARLLAAGLLEKKGFSALGVASRVDEEGCLGWEVRTFFGSGPLEISDYPTDVDVRLYVAAGSSNLIEFVPTGGARLTSDFLVFRNETKDETEGKFVLVGTGSVRDTSPRLYLVVPRTSHVSTFQGSEAPEIGTVSGRPILALTGTAQVEFGGERYRIVAGAASADGARIEVIGAEIPALQAERIAYRGCPTFMIHRGVLKSRGDDNSLRMRTAANGEPWRTFSPRSLPFGSVEVALFDNAACLDRVNFVHLPSDANVSLTIPAPDICRIALSNFGQSSIEPQETGPDVKTTVTRNHVTIEVRTDREKHRLLRLRARWQNSETIFSVPMLTRKAGFYDPDGVPIPKNHWTSLTSLLGASAEAVERASVLICVRGRHGTSRAHYIERPFERSLPFSQIHEDIERLFSMSDDLDAEVEVDALHAGTYASTLYVRRFDLVLASDPSGEVVLEASSAERLRSEGGAEAVVLGRPFRDFDGEDRRIQSYLGVSGRHWIVPDGEGPWFVYATVGGIPRSRLLLVNRTNNCGDIDPLSDALMAPARHHRAALIEAELVRIGCGSAPESRDRLIAFVASLSPALPLQSFDILRALPKATDAAIQMAVHCDEALLHRVLELEAKIPLTWAHTNPGKWAVAMSAQREDYRTRLRQAGVGERHADAYVARRADAIAHHQPCLSLHMAVALRELGLSVGADASKKLREASQVAGHEAVLADALKEMLRQAASNARKRNDDRRWPTDFGFRSRLPDLVSTFLEAPRWAEPVLDAPCVSAAIAMGTASWSPEIEGMVRMCRGFDASYFEEAFLYALALGRAQ